MKKVLIYDVLAPSIVPMLQTLGLEVIYEPSWNAKQIIEYLKNDVEIVIGRTKLPIDINFLNAAPHLEIIVRAGAGLDDIDVEAAQARAIQLINAPEGNREAVGEHTLALLLALTHNLTIADAQVRQGLWLREENRFNEISAYTVGVIGFGNMGKAFAKRVIALGGKVLAYDKYLKESGMEEVPLLGLEQLAQEVDVVSVHTPLTAETLGFIDDAFFDSFRKSIIFLNTSRGKVVDASALLSNIKTGKVLAAGLDVWENEKISTFSLQERQRFEELKGLKHIIISPHIAGLSKQSLEKINSTIYEKLQKIFKSQKI